MHHIDCYLDDIRPVRLTIDEDLDPSMRLIRMSVAVRKEKTRPSMNVENLANDFLVCAVGPRTLKVLSEAPIDDLAYKLSKG